MKLVLTLAVAAILAIASLSGTASAKGTLTVDPTTVPRNSSFTLAGCGYAASTAIAFHVTGPGVNYFTAGELLPLEGGCFSETWIAWWTNPGAYAITSYYRDSKGALRKVTVVKFAVT